MVNFRHEVAGAWEVEHSVVCLGREPTEKKNGSAANGENLARCTTKNIGCSNAGEKRDAKCSEPEEIILILLEEKNAVLLLKKQVPWISY